MFMFHMQDVSVLLQAKNYHWLSLNCNEDNFNAFFPMIFFNLKRKYVLYIIYVNQASFFSILLQYYQRIMRDLSFQKKLLIFSEDGSDFAN